MTAVEVNTNTMDNTCPDLRSSGSQTLLTTPEKVLVDISNEETPSKRFHKSSASGITRRSPRLLNKTTFHSPSSTPLKDISNASKENQPVTPDAPSKAIGENFYSSGKCFLDTSPKTLKEMTPRTRFRFYKKTLRHLGKVRSRVQRALARDMEAMSRKRSRSNDSLASWSNDSVTSRSNDSVTSWSNNSVTSRSNDSVASRSSVTKPKKRKKVPQKQLSVFGSVRHGVKKPQRPRVPKKKLQVRSQQKKENVGLVITFNKVTQKSPSFDLEPDQISSEEKRKFFKSPGTVALQKSMKLNDCSVSVPGKENKKRQTKKDDGILKEIKKRRSDSAVLKAKNDADLFKESKSTAELHDKPWRLSLSPFKQKPTCSDRIKAPEEEAPKFYPVFYKTHSQQSPDGSSKNSSNKKSLDVRKEADGKEQMLIDAGQKRLCSITCKGCGTLYNPGDVNDEFDHAKFHDRFVQQLKFPGWQNERVVADYLDARIVAVFGTDNASHWNKVEDVLEIADNDLGFSKVGIRNKNTSKAFLYVVNRSVVGCVIAERISSGFKVLGIEKESDTPQSWCSSYVPRPARCGVSRIWVSSQHRRKGIATRLLDAMRGNFVFAERLGVDNIAFSDPTPMGMAFARKYTDTPNFLIYSN